MFDILITVINSLKRLQIVAFWKLMEGQECAYGLHVPKFYISFGFEGSRRGYWWIIVYIYGYGHLKKSRNSSVRFSVLVIFAEKKDEEGWKIESRGNGEPNFEELGFQAILCWYWAYLKNLENWFWSIWCFPFHAWDGWSLNWRRWKRPEVVWRSGGRASEAWKEREAQAGGWWTFSTGRKGVSWISRDIYEMQKKQLQ